MCELNDTDNESQNYSLRNNFEKRRLNMKKLSSKKIITAFVLILAIFMSIVPLTVFASIAENKKEKSLVLQTSNCMVEEDEIYFSSTNQTHFTDCSNIQLSFVIKSENEIKEIFTESADFEVKNIDQNPLESKTIDIDLSCHFNKEFCSILLKVQLSNDVLLDITVYAFNTLEGVFISTISYDYCENLFLDFMIETGKLTENSKNKIVNDKFIQDVECETVITERNLEIVTNDNELDLNASSTGSGDTGYVLTILWQDDNGVYHPARYLTVKIRDREAVGTDELLATLVTNSEGKISFYFDNPDRFIDFEDGGYDIYVDIYVDDGNIAVGTYSLSTLTDSNYYLENVSTGVTYYQTYRFNKGGEITKAIQIMQAAGTARDFAKTMMGSQPPEIGILYPVQETETTKTSYNKLSSGDFIFLCEKTNSHGISIYECWDVIMHEYGHHIEYYKDITDGFGDPHGIKSNLAVELKDKFTGMSLAWSEGWATVFGMIAQNYYLSSLSNIDNIGNADFELNTSDTVVSYESPTFKIGDACELCVGAVLWDLYDNSSNEEYDVITMSATRWWNITTESGNKDLSVFSDRYISSYYPGVANRLKYGKLLSEYGMAPNFRVGSCYNGDLNGKTPYIMWEPGGNGSFIDGLGYSYDLKNDIFDIEIYDDNYNFLFKVTINNSNARTYSFTNYEWQQIRLNCSTKYTICIKGTDTADFYVSYYSGGLTYSIP